MNNYYKDKGLNNLLRHSFNKYDLLKFLVEILEYCDKQILIEKEQFYLNLFKLEYNIFKTANSFLGFKHSEKSKAKIKIVKLGKNLSEKTIKRKNEAVKGKKNPFFGKTHCQETLNKISQAKNFTIHNL